VVEGLIEKWAKMLDFLGYYQEGIHKKEQAGVVRTSCLDSLDRTNVVQSKLGWRALKLQVTLFIFIKNS